MEFTVPQFIEKEAKIVGPLTFKQFIFVGIAGALCMLLYFVVPLFLFVIFCILLIGGALALVFYKKEGFPLYTVIAKSFIYLFKPKIYLWKKKDVLMKFIKQDDDRKKLLEKQEEEENKGPRLKMSKSSRLNELLNEIEIK
jgi:hypothetical protein